ncbi:hypothetical protein [Tsukamurella spumae]|uniref:Uncharacterized protein n=1 Tax=Tsukamurella spumae TaxID=44753 RepID=A0A846WYP8_9ACTN|nr:hypothetical protein [Tsukamurella spumae]NKY17486.1 hypothetical protein [Tsukamurella spumae]
MALIALANGLLTNEIFGAPKGVYLFVGKTYPTTGVAGQTLRTVRGYSAATVSSSGWSAITPCETDHAFVCVGMNIEVEGASVVAFDFRPDEFVLEVGGAEVKSGGPAADATKMAVPVGPKTLDRGQTYSTAVNFAVPVNTVRSAAVFSWRYGGEVVAAWTYSTPLWPEPDPKLVTRPG